MAARSLPVLIVISFMSTNFSRRAFITSAAASTTAIALPGFAVSPDIKDGKDTFILNRNPLKLGLMTYLVGSKWDIETIIKNCKNNIFKTYILESH